ncbi:MAG TPA: hypothetical protein VGL56_17200 [Fimbriimonadaceae bacterium]|jgi:hypothetical protein
MPFIPLSVALTMVAGVPQRPNLSQIDTQLTILWGKRTATASPPGFVFENAQAIYGPSVLTCDKLTIDLEEGHKHFLAEGHVHIADIDGTLDADRIYVDWIDKTGSALNVDVNLQGLMIHAKAAELFPKNYELDDVYATPCGDDLTPLIAITAPKAIINRSGDGKIFKPTLYMAGRHILTLKEYTITPDRKSTSLPLPSVSFSRASGLSEGWVPALPINDTTEINGSEHLGQHGIPSEDLQISKSLLPTSVLPAPIVPYSDFSERFGWSYFENVYVGTPAIEQSFDAGRRFSISAATTWNEYPVARQISDRMNKPAELIVEAAGPVGQAGLYGQLRAQQIQEAFGPKVNRVEGITSFSLPQFDLLPHIYTDIRLDNFFTIGEAKPYGWAHAQAGIVSRINRHLRLGVAYTRGVNYGTPEFITDELYKLQSVNFRADLEYGPRTFSLLAKYDPTGQDWFDTEIEFSQDVRCFQPYVIYRAFPRGYVFGIRLRLDNVMDALRRRGAIKSTGTADADR